MHDKQLQTIYFLIVNYNGSEDTIKLIESLISLEKPNLSVEAIIIDNASNQEDIDTINAFTQEINWVKLIESKSNAGYFSAFNVGLELIHNELPATVLLCNNDLIFEKDFLSLYLEKKYDDDVFVVAPNVITLDGVHQNPHLISKIGIIRKLANEIYFSHYFVARISKGLSNVISKLRKHNKSNNSEKSQFIHMGIGACYILKPRFFQHINRLDDRVFLGGEEALLSGQLSKVHGKTYYESSLIVHHAEGVSFSKMPTRWRYEVSKKSYPIYKEYL